MVWGLENHGEIKKIIMGVHPALARLSRCRTKEGAKFANKRKD